VFTHGFLYLPLVILASRTILEFFTVLIGAILILFRCGFGSVSIGP
jgi:hypothetical protein